MRHRVYFVRNPTKKEKADGLAEVRSVGITFPDLFQAQAYIEVASNSIDRGFTKAVLYEVHDRLELVEVIPFDKVQK